MYSAGDLIHAVLQIVNDPSEEFTDFVESLRANIGVIQAIARRPEARALGNDLLLKLKFPRLFAQVDLPDHGSSWNATAAAQLVRSLKAPTQTALWVVQWVKESLTVQNQRTWYVFDDGLWSAVPDGFAAHYCWFRAVVAHMPQALADVGFTRLNQRALITAISDLTGAIARYKADKTEPTIDSEEQLRSNEFQLKAIKAELELFDKGIVPILDTELERIFPKVMDALIAMANMQTPGEAFDNSLEIIVTPSYAINLKRAAERRIEAFEQHGQEGFFDPELLMLGGSFVPRRSLARRFLTKSMAVDPVVSSGDLQEFDYDSKLLWEKAPNFMSILRYQWATADHRTYAESLADTYMWDQVRALQRLLGYMATGYQSAKCSVALIGPTNTGKSTLTRAIARCFGDYCAQPDVSILIPKHGESVRPEDLVKIYGARLAIIGEVPGQKVDSQTWKRLTGGDEITVRHLYQKSIQWKAQTKVLIVGNDPPTIENDAASKHRFVAVPFKRPVVKMDSHLEERIAHETPIITRWILEGALDWYYNTYVSNMDAQDAFGLPIEWREYSTELIESVDAYHDFFTEWVTDTSEQSWLPVAQLYKVFELWCEKTNTRVITMNGFGRLLRSRDFEKARIGVTKTSCYRCQIISTNPAVSNALNQMRNPT